MSSLNSLEKNNFFAIFWFWSVNVIYNFMCQKALKWLLGWLYLNFSMIFFELQLLDESFLCPAFVVSSNCFSLFQILLQVEYNVGWSQRIPHSCSSLPRQESITGRFLSLLTIPSKFCVPLCGILFPEGLCSFGSITYLLM